VKENIRAASIIGNEAELVDEDVKEFHAPGKYGGSPPTDRP
jgi:hypothetical protein